jgi:nucleolar protein 15
MKEYFSQFGEITRLRLSRNRATGRSKHYAFIEFASSVVAKIVAETMNNYLMYGHILKCKFVPQEQQHAELWKGSNRRYKRVPWNRIEKQRLDRGKTRDKWTKSIEHENARRLNKAAKLKGLMDYEYEVPGLKAIDTVPIQETLPAPEAPAQIEAAEKDAPAKDTADAVVSNGVEKEAEKEAVADEQTPKKAAKKAKKEKASETPDVKKTPTKVAEQEQTTPSATPESSSKKTKAKKAKKSAGKA